MRRIARVVFLLIVLVSFSVAPAFPAGAEGADSCVHPQVSVRLLTDRDYIHMLIEGIDTARFEIVLCAYLFKTIENADGYPERVMKSLSSAAKRGVRVFALMELNQESGDLIRSNAVTAERLKKAGITVCPDPVDIVSHMKLVVIDRRYLFIGSHNLTQAALKYNHEASVWIDSPFIAREALGYVDSICRFCDKDNKKSLK